MRQEINWLIFSSNYKYIAKTVILYFINKSMIFHLFYYSQTNKTSAASPSVCLSVLELTNVCTDLWLLCFYTAISENINRQQRAL